MEAALRNRIEPSVSNIRNPDWQYFHTYIRANQWVLIADVQSTTVTNKAYWEDVCANRGDMAFNDTMKIEMGSVTDYFRPTEDMTLCEFLTADSTDEAFRWAASEDGPFFGKYNGYMHYFPKCFPVEAPWESQWEFPWDCRWGSPC